VTNWIPKQNWEFLLSSEIQSVAYQQVDYSAVWRRVEVAFGRSAGARSLILIYDVTDLIEHNWNQL